MEFIQAVKDANLEIYKLINSTSHEKLCENTKVGIGGDLGIVIDCEAEKIFAKHLLKFGKIYSEESGYIGDNENTIILDPIDGSENFKSNIPYFGTSVALKQNEKITDAITTNLVNGDMFIKTDDTFIKASIFNNEKKYLQISKLNTIGIFEKAYNSHLHSKLKELNLKYRSPGALALSLAICYEVSFVLFEGKIREFDIAAGWKMGEELFRFKNDKYLLVSKDKIIFDKIYQLIKKG
ncbi:MAG: inositol monophosphatase [Campylobacteraceae bacterium]|jgi:myo-inositol-1(or 4)-monophosphatase|nr:inositol monophosphatase [Campylobacteraceae bacterium]